MFIKKFILFILFIYCSSSSANKNRDKVVKDYFINQIEQVCAKNEDQAHKKLFIKILKHEKRCHGYQYPHPISEFSCDSSNSIDSSCNDTYYNCSRKYYCKYINKSKSIGKIIYRVRKNPKSIKVISKENALKNIKMNLIEKLMNLYGFDQLYNNYNKLISETLIKRFSFFSNKKIYPSFKKSSILLVKHLNSQKLKDYQVNKFLFNFSIKELKYLISVLKSNYMTEIKLKHKSGVKFLNETKYSLTNLNIKPTKDTQRYKALQKTSYITYSVPLSSVAVSKISYFTGYFLNKILKNKNIKKEKSREIFLSMYEKISSKIEVDIIYIYSYYFKDNNIKDINQYNKVFKHPTMIKLNRLSLSSMIEFYSLTESRLQKQLIDKN
jgi:hypothetical protein